MQTVLPFWGWGLEGSNPAADEPVVYFYMKVRGVCLEKNLFNSSFCTRMQIRNSEAHGLNFTKNTREHWHLRQFSEESTSNFSFSSACQECV